MRIGVSNHDGRRGTPEGEKYFECAGAFEACRFGTNVRNAPYPTFCSMNIGFGVSERGMRHPVAQLISGLIRQLEKWFGARAVIDPCEERDRYGNG